MAVVICIYEGCSAQLWKQTQSETDAAATDLGWRHWVDGKVPQLSVGACLCPDHKQHEYEFQPAAAKKGRT